MEKSSIVETVLVEQNLLLERIASAIERIEAKLDAVDNTDMSVKLDKAIGYLQTISWKD